MNTAQDIFDYSTSHNISMVADGGKLKINGPEAALTDDFLNSAKTHKQELIKALSERCDTELMELVSDACNGRGITPDQFIALTTKEDRELILSGDLPLKVLRAYARSFSEGIQTGRITFHPTFHHGIPNTKQYKA